MKMYIYTFMFKAGKISVMAICESEGRIIAQAEAIKRGWNYTILDSSKEDIAHIELYEVTCTVDNSAYYSDKVKYVYAQNEVDAADYIINKYESDYWTSVEIINITKIIPQEGLILKGEKLNDKET